MTAKEMMERLPPSKWDEALLLEQTGGFLTALPHESTENEWNMQALVRALKAGEVSLPLDDASAERFRRHPPSSPELPCLGRMQRSPNVDEHASLPSFEHHTRYAAAS